MGTENYRRGTIDVNTPVSALGAAAFRINAVWHESDIAERNILFEERKGVAPSLALGVGKPTRLTLSYYYLDQKGVADYGLPVINGQVAPVRRSSYYGFADLNTEQTTTSVATALLEHDVNDAVTLRSQFRYGETDRYAIVSVPRAASLVTNSLTRNPTGRDATTTLAVNQTDATIRFTTGAVAHSVVTGFEVSQEVFKNQPISFAGAPADNLTNPNPYTPFTGTRTLGNRTETEATSTAVYAFDTVKLGSQWEIVGGLRWDRFEAETRTPATATTISRTDEMTSGRAGIVYKPMANGSVYAAYGTPFNPAAESLSVGAATTDPEENRSFEIGTKWDLMRNRLSLTAAAFRTEKTNARTATPGGGLTVLEGEQRVDSIELGVSGRITDAWQVFGGYTYHTSEIVKSRNPAEVGRELSNTPAHSFSLWTTYQFPWNLQAGVGIQYVDERFINNTNTGTVDSYMLLEAMAAYAITEKVDLRLNVYNITDEFYIDRLHAGGAHAVPGAGRTAVLSTSFKF